MKYEDLQTQIQRRAREQAEQAIRDFKSRIIHAINDLTLLNGGHGYIDYLSALSTPYGAQARACIDAILTDDDTKFPDCIRAIREQQIIKGVLDAADAVQQLLECGGDED